jgi:hypothetical protein
MSVALGLALVFTVLLFFTTAYFVLGSIPLLVLKHDTPVDARFVRGFFDTYYKLAVFAAGGTAICFAFADRFAFAAGAAALAVLALVLRRQIIPKMDALGAGIQADAIESIPGFRKTHLTAIAINIAQLAAIVWALIGLRL